MEPTPLLLLLSLGWTCTAQTGLLTILPQDPLVEIGGSIQLNCFSACPEGNPQWKGLDTNLVNIISKPNKSTLLVSNATTAMEGMKICVEQCQKKTDQRTVNLQVYSLPDSLQLETHPKELVAGQPAHLNCSISKVYPPGVLTLRWYQGNETLETLQPEEEAYDEELFTYTAKLEVSAQQVKEGTEFRCEVQLLLTADRSFHRARAVTVSTKALAEEPTDESITSQETPRMESSAATKNPSAPDWRLTTGPVATTETHPMEETSPAKPTTEITGTSHDASTSVTSVPSLVSTEPLGVASSTTNTDLNPHSSAPGKLTTDYVPTTQSSLPKTATISQPPTTESACTLLIRSIPPSGTIGEALKIICEANCSEEVSITWVKTPVELSRYQKDVSERKSILKVDRGDLSHQGIYQCSMLNKSSQRATLYISVSAANFNTDAAITVGTAGSLLGLIITAVTSRRLWKRLHTRNACGQETDPGLTCFKRAAAAAATAADLGLWRQDSGLEPCKPSAGDAAAWV